MRRNHGFSRVLGVIVAGCLLVSGFIASPANAAEDIKKSVQSQKIMDERPAALDENTPSTFSERSNEPVSSVTGVTLGDGYKARTDYISIDQRNTKRDALNAVIKWRKDALNDARIKFKYDGSWKNGAGIFESGWYQPTGIPFSKVVECFGAYRYSACA